MNVKQIVAICDVRESQALAFCDIYKDKLDNATLQTAIDNYCNQMAKSLIQNCTPIIYEEKFRQDIKKYLYSVGADKLHSGKRFHEAFFKQIVELEKKYKYVG